MIEKKKREIIVRAFVNTGKDHEEGLIEYISILERTVLRLYKKAGNRPRLSDNVEAAIAWAENNG